jgi:phage gp36-like protein
LSSYGSPSDLALYGIDPAALDSFDDGEKQAVIDAASVLADSYFRQRYGETAFPFIRVGDDVVRNVCQIAAYDLLFNRGFNPSMGADLHWRARRDDAERWLVRVAKGEVTPDITPAAQQSPTYDSPQVLTSTKQGW